MVLRGDQIKYQTEKAIKNCRLKNVSNKFKESLREFLTKIADESEEIRKIVG